MLRGTGTVYKARKFEQHLQNSSLCTGWARKYICKLVTLYSVRTGHKAYLQTPIPLYGASTKYIYTRTNAQSVERTSMQLLQHSRCAKESLHAVPSGVWARQDCDCDGSPWYSPELYITVQSMRTWCCVALVAAWIYSSMHICDNFVCTKYLID